MTSLSTLCYIEKDGQYLMLHRTVKKNDVNKDKWIGIGGHFEEGESPEECLLREVREETGLKISAPVLCGIKDWCNADGSRYMVLLYKTDRFEGELHASDEGNVFWLELDDMKKANLAHGMAETLDVFLNERLSEYYFHQENGEWIEALK